MSEEKQYCKTIQLIHGVDLLGSRMSLTSKRGDELELTSYGVKAFSKNTKRTVLIPWNNIRGVEMYQAPVNKVLPADDYEKQFAASAVQAKPRGRPKAQV